MEENKLLDKEFVVHIDVKNFLLFLNTESLVLLVDAEEEDKLLDSSSSCLRGGEEQTP